jgi:hypothetical protein
MAVIYTNRAGSVVKVLESRSTPTEPEPVDVDPATEEPLLPPARKRKQRSWLAKKKRE